MPDQESKYPTAEELRADRERLRIELAARGFDGPKRIDTGAGFGLGSLFGVEPTYAVCHGCGAAIFLNDPLVAVNGSTIERGIYRHVQHHERLNDPLTPLEIS